MLTLRTDNLTPKIMQTKQTIVIFGTGLTGKTIATLLASGNFQLLLCDKEYSKAVALAEELKDVADSCTIEAMECAFDGAWEADVVVLALQMEEQVEVAAYIKDVINQKILISSIESDPGSNNCQERLRALLPHTKIVRIDTGENTNTNTSSSGQNASTVVLSGDDDMAIQVVADMLGSAGVRIKRAEHPPVPDNQGNLHP